MTKQSDLLAATIERMLEVFPHAFFAKSTDVKPLKIGINEDLFAALPDDITPYQAKRFLAWYVNRPAYLHALAKGAGRVDLTGTMVDTDMPEKIRGQAKQRLEALQQGRRPGSMTKPVLVTLLNLEELYAMAINAKLEVTLKFSTLPQARPAGPGKMAFALKTPDGQFITAVVGTKAWNKLVKANADWPSWVAALSGTMGERTEKGFTLAGPGLQVFEKKAKTAEATPQPVDTTPAPVSPTESVTPPQPAAPITVTTGAGTATVTKRTPLSLKRNASTGSKPEGSDRK